jgi:hypothetical protein
MRKAEILMNKAYAVSFSILERSKDFMFTSFYQRIKPNFEYCKLLMTDTDSFVLALDKQNIDDDVWTRMQDIMEYSNYPKTHPKYNDCKKNALGYFKDELQGDRMEEFCGIRSKCYAMKILRKVSMDYEVKSALKGVRKAYKKTINFDAFLSVLKERKEHRMKQFVIQSRNHVLSLSSVNKLCFSSFDDKRFLLSCGIHSLPYGHYRLLGEKNRFNAHFHIPYLNNKNSERRRRKNKKVFFIFYYFLFSVKVFYLFIYLQFSQDFFFRKKNNMQK